MPAEPDVSIALLMSFLAVLIRVSGAIIFIPIPGIRSGPDIARVVLALGLTVALYPAWPVQTAQDLTLGHMLLLVLSETAFGVTAGLAAAFLLEGFMLSVQILGLQAGFSYSSTIDPSSQADSTVLQVLIQLVSALLFFTLGIHYHVIRAFSTSLETLPPGAFRITGAHLDLIMKLGSGMLALGVRLALPVVALLLLLDLAMALMGRINSQLQLLSLAFPAKMLAGLLLLAALAPLLPRLFEASAARTIQAISVLASGH